ncbi:PLDc N-terminal domain-containing protein [Algoriphagus halophilus]|uniref:PLDc N-terminal domain-containing protein n=1 Tax=Algoriphagus halophilus TaxID=226505 RepID=UPI0038996876
MIRSDFRGHPMKLIWALVILMVPTLGTFLYIRMNQMTKKDFRRFEPNFSKHRN